MQGLTVGKLKAILEDAHDVLRDYDDEAEVHASCNTYGLGGNYISIPDVGFVPLDSIAEAVEGDDDGDEDDGND